MQTAGEAALLQWRQRHRLGPAPASAALSAAGRSLLPLYAAAFSSPAMRDHAGDMARIEAQLAEDGGEVVQASGPLLPRRLSRPHAPLLGSATDPVRST